MKKGIIITAMKHPHYGQYAYNLAVTLKAVSSLPIALVYDNAALKHLDESQRQIFDLLIPKEGKPIELRLSLPEISPFEETLAIDADTLWLKKDPEEVFTLLQDRDITFSNEGYFDLDMSEDHTSKFYTYWADREELVKAYKLTGRFYQTRGEFIVFRNSEAVKDLYKLGRSIYRKPKVSTTVHGGDVTDEFALNIAVCKKGLQPHADIWEPAYWPGRHGNLVKSISLLREDYYAFSAGGNEAPKDVVRAYGIISRAAANTLNVQQVYTLKPKKHNIKDRITA